MSTADSRMCPGRFARRFSLLMVVSGALWAADPAHGGAEVSSDAKATTPTTEPAPEEPKNWIELGIGGLIINGDQAQFKQQHGMSGDVFGGIQDFHYEHAVGSDGGQLTADGHAIWDSNDYDVNVKLSQPKLGYIQAGFTEFRSWYDGDGGFLPHHNVWFDPAFPEMHIDRGDVWAEAGLQVPDLPEITFRYDHFFRNGMKDSTIWGDTTLTGLANNPARKLAPAFRDIDETRDVFQLDASKTFGDTDVIIGMRYEHDDNNDDLKLERGAGQLPPAVAAPGAQRFITQKDDISSDIWNGHAITETRFTDNLWFTNAYSYSSLSADISGSRVYGETYDAPFGNFPTLQSNDHAILNLAGMSSTQEHVFNSNLYWVPLTDLSCIVGFRYTHEDTDSSSMFLDANTATSPPPTHYLPAIPKFGDTSVSLNDCAERLELRYTHIKDWTFYTEGEWDEEWGNLHQHIVSGSLVNNAPVPSDLGALNKDSNVLEQKYTVGATWYPMANLNMAAQYYYKIASYDNDFHSDLATPPTPGAERNQRLIGQDWTSNDANFRITWHPKLPAWMGTMSLVGRYDFIQSYVSGKWAISPNATGDPPTNTILNEEWTGTITQHDFTGSVNWNPLPRFYLQTTFSYILNQTETRANEVNLIFTGTTQYNSPTVTNFRNDFWTVTSAAGYIIDDKTDLRCEYTFYRAADYQNNDKVAMPYGAGQKEQTVSATVTRELSKNMHLLFKYTYFTYEDQTSGNHNNYEAHAFYSGLQYRF